MKFIAFWEFKPEDLDNVIEKYKQWQREKKGLRSFQSFSFHHIQWWRMEGLCSI